MKANNKLLTLGVLVSVVLMFLPSKSICQYTPFPTDSAAWLIKRTHFDSGTPYWYGDEYIFMNGDTIVNNIEYTKLNFRLMDAYSTSEGLYGLLREENKKIYFKIIHEDVLAFMEDTSEFILYDFNLNIGDSFQIVDSYGNEYSTIVLDSDSVQLHNGEYRARLLLDEIDNICGSMEWIEGIGNVAYHPFYSNFVCFEHSLNFLCYHANNDTLWGECPVIANVDEIKNDYIAEVYPNPSKNELNITDKSFENSKYLIISTSGIVMLSGTVINSKINIQSIANGIYYLAILEDDKRSILKFVKI